MGGTASSPAEGAGGPAADPVRKDLNSLSEEEFKAEVRDSAARFKAMVTANKVSLIYSCWTVTPLIEIKYYQKKISVISNLGSSWLIIDHSSTF